MDPDGAGPEPGVTLEPDRKKTPSGATAVETRLSLHSRPRVEFQTRGSNLDRNHKQTKCQTFEFLPKLLLEHRILTTYTFVGSPGQLSRSFTYPAFEVYIDLLTVTDRQERSKQDSKSFTSQSARTRFTYISKAS